jgi:hypothetical protein
MMILGDLAEQSLCRSKYVAAALANGRLGLPVQTATVEKEQAVLEKNMAVLWRLRWDNINKETLWRLTVNGVVGAGGHGISQREPCPCGWCVCEGAEGQDAEQMAFSWRTHCFWHCPVARAVISELSTALPASVCVECADVWLLRSPLNAGVHAGVWALVCMVALAAMAFGRKLLWALSLGEDDARDSSQSLITDFFPLLSGSRPPVSLVQRASRKAAAQFWVLLQDFVAVQEIPSGWGTEVAPDHPFVGVETVGGGVVSSQGGGRWRLRLNVPPGFNLPDNLF